MSAVDDQFDAEADETIISCLNLDEPRSFFLYAGAGSGKTRSLVEAIRRLCREQGRRLTLTGQKIGVITYTNAACDEIKQRLELDPRIEVATIHSFAWSLIAGYDTDIRQWVAARLLRDIAELTEAQSKGRAASKAAADRARSIDSKLRRHAGLDQVARFVYSPMGDNRTRDALSHAEVIAMMVDFLNAKPGMRRLLVARFPILLIDESQDTNSRVMDALLGLQAAQRDAFCLGLFGDVMQRIYADGKVGLDEAIPESWARPRKRMNHRCPTRVVELINRVRYDADQEQQVPRSDAMAGVVRLFIVPQTTTRRAAIEAAIAARMAEFTGDRKWATPSETIKTLALEHLMAARRFGFEAFFEPLYSIEGNETNVLQGTGAGIGLFTREIVPLVSALRASDKFAAAAIVRRTSPLLERRVLEDAGENQAAILERAKAACDGLLSLVTAGEGPAALSVLRYVAETRIFTVPDVLAPYVVGEDVAFRDDAGEEEDRKSELGGWRRALEAPFEQIEKYDRYVRGLSQFDTHQGVKGREFPRVMVVISDDEARGFMFSYDKLFGAKEKSSTDLANEAAGKDSSIDRTRRLFYVTCSRAEESLAVVYYTTDPAFARDAMIRQDWFRPNEIEIVGS